MKNATISITLAAALVAGAVWWRFGAKSFAAEAVYPAGRARHSLSSWASSRFRAFFRRRELAEENRRLRSEVDMLSAFRMEAERTMDENSRLRALLGYAPGARAGWLAAPVLSRGGAAGAMRIVAVGRGSLDGVAVNDLATVREGVVGRVIEVSPHVSEVLLVSDQTSNIACELKTTGARRVFGIVTGAGDSRKLRIRHLPADVAVAPRTEVVTSGRGGIFPAGFRIGFTAEIGPSPDGLEQEGSVIIAADLAGAEDVLLRHVE